MERSSEKLFEFSNRHLDLAARDHESIMGWRYSPRIVFTGGKGAKLDVAGNEYYDCSAGMMCLVLGHAHPELVDTIKEQAKRIVHQSSWYSNPWAHRARSFLRKGEMLRRARVRILGHLNYYAITDNAKACLPVCPSHDLSLVTTRTVQ